MRLWIVSLTSGSARILRAFTCMGILLTVALLPLEAVQTEDRAVAVHVTTVLYAALSKEKGLQLVERERLDEILREQAATLSGLTSEDRGVRVGQLVAAKIVIVGRVARVGEQVLMTARAMGTETGRLLVETEAIAPAQVGDGAKRLGTRLSATLAKRGSELVAPPDKRSDPIEEVRRALRGKTLPRVTVVVTERFTGAEAVDPAVETELLYALQRCGFEVVDAAKVRQAAGGKAEWWLHAGEMIDVVIIGEAILERATNFNNLVSGRARVELKSLDTKTGKGLAVARLTKSAVDVSPAAAAKSAAQHATQQLLRDFLTEMTTAWGKTRE